MQVPHFKTNRQNFDEAVRFIDIFRLAALQAGCAASRLQNDVSLGEKAGQSSPEGAALTAVDLAAQDIILHLLHAALPEVSVDAEEDTETLGLFPSKGEGRPIIVVDPIDGTLNYARGSRDYAVMGAFVQEQRYQAVVVYFPACRKLFWARGGHGCWVQTADTPPRRVRLDGRSPSSVLVTSSFPPAWKSKLEDSGFQVGISRCSAIDASAPVNGRAAAAISMGKLGRRRAIGMLLTREAGGVVKISNRDWQGEDPLSLSDRRGPVIVAESAQTAARITAALKKGG